MMSGTEDGSRCAERGRRIWSAGFRPALRADYPVRAEPLPQSMTAALRRCAEAIDRSQREAARGGAER